MGRRYEPVDAPVESLASLAADLRRLRARAGDPPYRAMAVEARYSASTLSEAASGRRLPTLPVLLAYVTVCGASTEGWEDRWLEVKADLHDHHGRSLPPPRPARDPGAAGSGVGTGPDRPDVVTLVPRRPRITVRKGHALAAGALGLGLAAACGAWLLFPAPSSHARATTAVQAIREDTDPQDTGCDQGDVRTLARSGLYGPGRFFVGYVWLRYSTKCAAMWARFEPAPGMTELEGAQVGIWLDRPSDGRTLHYATPYLGQFVYGNMLRATHGCLRARATVTAPHPTRGPAAAIPGTGRVVAHAETACLTPSGGAPASPRS